MENRHEVAVTEPLRKGAVAERSFRAFISYAHAADGPLASALQRGLHRLAKPWYRAPSFRVFRDQSSLSASPTLWSSIESALAASEFLIVLASPSAAQSEWVNREVEWWLQHKSAKRILLVLTEGEVSWLRQANDFDWRVSTALPPALRGAFSEEPLWVDLRWARTARQPSLKDPLFRNAVADLAAPLHGVAKEQLVGEDLLQQRRTIRVRNAVIAALTVLTVVAVIASIQFLQQRNEARDQRDLALSRQLSIQSDRITGARPELAMLVGLESLSVGRRQNVQPSPGLVSALARVDHASQRYELAGPATSIAYQPNGTLIALGNDDGSITLWDVAVGRVGQRVAEAHGGAVQSLAFSPDGKVLASTGDKDVKLWDVPSGRPIRTLSGHTGAANAVAFSPDGRLLASGAIDKTVRLWDVATGHQVGRPLIRHTDAVFDVAFSPDGKELASAGADARVVLWDIASRAVHGKPLEGHTESVNAVAFSPKGNRLASAALDGSVRLWDSRSGAQIGGPLTFPFFADPTATANDVAFSPDGTLVAAAGPEGVQLWDALAGRPVGLPLLGATDIVRTLAFSPDGASLAAASDDRTMHIWQVKPTESISRPFTGHTAEVYDVAFSPDGKTLATASGDQTVRLWDVATGAPRGNPLVGHEGLVLAVAFSPDGKLLASAGEDETVRLWDVSTGKPHGTPFRGHSNWVTRVAFSPDGHLLASGSNDRTVKLWDVASGRQLGKDLVHDRGVVSLSFSPDGKQIAAGDQAVRIWDVATTTPAREPLAGSGSEVNAVAFSPDGKTLASADDNKIRIWDLATGKQILSPLTGHTGPVTDIAFRPDSRLLASSGNDGTIRLWDLPSGEPHGSPLSGHLPSVPAVKGNAGAIEQIAFSTDGSHIASAGDDTTARLWTVDFTDWVPAVCHIVSGNLSLADWTELIEGLPYERTCANDPKGAGAPDSPAAPF